MAKTKIELVQQDTSAKARNLKTVQRLIEEKNELNKLFIDRIRKVDEDLEIVSQKLKKALEEAETESIKKCIRDKSDLLEVRNKLEETLKIKMGVAPAESVQVRKLFDEVKEEGDRKVRQKKEQLREIMYKAFDMEKEMQEIVNEYNQALATIQTLDPDSSYQKLDVMQYGGVNSLISEYRTAEVNKWHSK